MTKPPPKRTDRIRRASAERRSRQKEELRRAILDAAVELFRERGYENFSMRQVAEAIGYSPTTIYLYFDDKDDLLFHAAMAGFARFGEVLQAAYDASDDPLERLREEGRAYVRFGLDNPVSYRLMFMQRGEFLDREPPEGCDSLIDSFGILTRTIEECLAAGLIRPGDVRIYAGMIWAQVHGVVALAISTSYFDEAAALAILEQQQDALMRGIRRSGEE